MSQRPDNSTHRISYADLHRRARSLAATLQRLGLHRGDRVGTLMWNHTWISRPISVCRWRGALLHTLNLRLHPDKLEYIVNHAEDRFLIVDDVLLPVFEKTASEQRS